MTVSVICQEKLTVKKEIEKKKNKWIKQINKFVSFFRDLFIYVLSNYFFFHGEIEM